MATFNRVLIVLIAILAVGAAVMSFLLFQHRNAFRDRASVLAETVVSMVRWMDEDSNTDYDKEVTFGAADPVEGLPESGMLSWQKYLEDPQAYKRTLGEAEELSEQLAEQRNYLTENLAQVGFDLQLPVDALDVADLRDLSNADVYQDATQKVVRLGKAVHERSEDMIRTIVNTGTVAGITIDEANIRERNEDINADGETILKGFNHGGELEKFNDAIVSLNTRAQDYMATIAEAMNDIAAWDWSTTAESVKDPQTYNQALSALSNDFSDLNDRLVAAAAMEQQLQQARTELDEALADLEQVTKERDRLRKQLTGLAPSGTGPDDETGGDVGQPTYDLAGGKVVHVNHEWKFAILNLGRRQIRENIELLAARDGAFVARLLVTRVTPKISVAEILPMPKSDAQIQEGDRVLLPASIPETTKEAAPKEKAM
ncbi:MAG: hypothetical protein K9N51_06015 [Candidatus Pacebacteria bacterium]|nr:hypothetical protein [Candidatus Paceibacterota bacterium]